MAHNGITPNPGFRTKAVRLGQASLPFGYNAQSGVVLIICLIMLLLLTLISITGMQTTSLEEKMAGNMRDKNLAFQAAESALTAAEKSLDVAASLPTFSNTGTNGFYSATPTTAIATALNTITDDSFWTANPKATSSVTTLGNSINTPYYIIQDLGCFNPTTPCATANHYYRITVRASGASTNTVVILQSIYSPP